jgi:N-acetylneuraminate synthase
VSCLVIAEAGVNHNGSLEQALALVDAAADAGADAVKFQTFRATSVVAPGARRADYQVATTGTGDQLSLIRALELSEEAHFALAKRCRERGIEFMSTPFDAWGLELLLKVGVRRLKIASGELTNRPFLESVAATGRPVILSTGMANLAEVQEAVGWLQDTWGAAGPARVEADGPDPLVVLHCVSNYPADPADANLAAMGTLHQATGLPIGFSDHTAGIDVALAAVAMGARVLEKHVTLDRRLPGPDHAASLEPAEFARMLRGIRTVEAAIGDGRKEPRASELCVRDLVRRSVTLTRSVSAGHVLTRADLDLLRPGTGVPPRDLQRVVGQAVARDLPCGHTLAWSDLK